MSVSILSIHCYHLPLLQEDSSEEKCHYFVKTALQPLVEVLLGQLTKQEEGQDLDDNIWNVSMASGTALSLIAQTVADDVVPLAMPYVQVDSGTISTLTS